jgi:phospholipid-binding lipoprotein MlaA
MTGIKLTGTFLIAVMMFACPVWAEGNPDKGAGNPDAGQVSGRNEMTARSETPLSVMAEATVSGNEAAPKAEVVPKDEISPETEIATETEATPEPGEPEEVVEEVTISDPIEPWNRMMFQFNDKLYFWALKPVAQGYNAVLPEPARVSVNNFFKNVAMPVRFVNSLLQGKFKSAGTEIARFGINTTIGLAGFFDVAKNRFDLYEQNEDLGQTLGVYGMPGMMYIVWPFFGPSTVRDTIGSAGDSFLDGANYIDPFYVPMSLHAYDRINKTSLDLTTYEDLKNSSVEPYTAMRDAYIQYRQGLIKK